MKERRNGQERKDGKRGNSTKDEMEEKKGNDVTRSRI